VGCLVEPQQRVVVCKGEEMEGERLAELMQAPALPTACSPVDRDRVGGIEYG